MKIHQISFEDVIDQWVNIAAESNRTAAAWRSNYLEERSRSNTYKAVIACAILMSEQGYDGIQWLRNWINGDAIAIDQFRRYLQIYPQERG